MSSVIEIQPEYKMLINGEFVSSQSGETFPSINPATKEVLSQIPRGDKQDAELAISAANKAKKAWGETSITERSNILLKIADRIEAALPELAKIETADNGKPIRETLNADLPLIIDHFRYFGGLIRGEEDTHSSLSTHIHSYNYKEPLGVVAQVVPWNFPSLMATWKVAPALAAGNTVVIKLSETTSISFLVIASLINDLLPPGVLNIITGYGVEAGAPLVNSPDVNKLAFTGSTAVGESIALAGAKNMKPVTLELGGKSPVLVFPDAMKNKEKLIDNLTLAALLNQSHICTCGSRHLIHEDIFDEVATSLVDRFEKVIVGDPQDENTQMGAINSEIQFNKIMSYIDIAKNDPNIEILTGGNAIHTDKGYFIEPTIVVASNESQLAQNEIFGPVLVLIRFSTEEEAVKIANDTDYGLGAGLFTYDALRIQRITKLIEAGRIWVNTYHQYPAHAPFGGYKKSGFGRETHKMLLDSYTQNKNVIIDYSDQPSGFYPAS